MNTIEIENILAGKGLRPTANRISVWRALSQATSPVNIADLEDMLVTMDKASIFRVLTLFVKNDVVHSFEDGSGTTKYELCHGRDHHSIDDMHAHFHCEICGETTCIDGTTIPRIALPEGFVPKGVNYTIKGICNKCAKMLKES